MITIKKKTAAPAKPFRSLGIDLSLNATGLVLLEARDAGPHVLIETEVKVPEGDGIQRKHAIVERIIEVVDEWHPDRIVIEGYSLGKNMKSTIPLVEIGSLLRCALWMDGHKWLDPNAPQVKKFATGKGNSPKDVVMMHVLKRWGHESKTNNTADGFVCAAIGLAHANRLAKATVEQRTIAGSVKLNAA